MTQQDVLDFLKKNSNKWLFARDISTSLKASYNCITRNLRSLREGDLVLFRNVGKRGVFTYRYKD